MNLETYANPTSSNTAAILVQRQTFSPTASRISRYEFEQLLQRAMEILNARDLAEQIIASFRPRA